MKTLRPSFDAACAALAGTPEALTPAQCSALWAALNPTQQQTRYGRQRWSDAALSLREPLRIELNTVAKQIVKQQFVGLIATSPGKPPLELSLAHARYVARLEDIRLRMDAALRTHGHWCLATDESFAQPLRVVVANERAAGRPAGNADWTQWEFPATVRLFTNIFDTALADAAKRGPQWSPYLPNGARKPGAAANKKLMQAWRGAFHDAIAIPLTAALADPHGEPVARFYETLKTPLMQQHIEDAIRDQLLLRQGPTNHAFTRPGRSLWHALDIGVRTALAAAYHDALTRAGLSTILTPNPWALTEDELNEVSA
jgi:hypothetical protein